MNNPDLLRNKIKLIDERIKKCDLCPRNCKVNRSNGELGFCKAPRDAVVYSYVAHPGEEPPISGRHGSGTVFFSYCTLRCAYCQNYKFSQLQNGKSVSDDELSDIFLKLQGDGCHNINLVTPTHFLQSILKALDTAGEKGLKIPIVYNTSGYENLDTLEILDGIADIYLADIRYSGNEPARKFSCAQDYADVARKAISKMYKSVGNLKMERGIAKKGLIVRLLILPNDSGAIEETLKFLSKDVSKEIYISLMSQYMPAYKASGFKEISRRISQKEYDAAVQLLDKYGLKNGWVQDFVADERLAGTNLRPIE